MITMAHGEGHELFALVVNADAAACRERLGAFGVTHVVDVSTPGRAWHPDGWADAVVHAMNRFGIETLMGLTSPRGRDLLPRIAAALDAPLVMDCVSVDLNRNVARTSQYSGKAMAEIQLTGGHYIYGIRAGAVTPVPRPAAVEVHACPAPAFAGSGLTVLDTRAGEAGTVDLAEADIILSGGRGMKNGENFQVLHDCARAMGAAVGASRVAVDEGWVPYSFQVGQTGTKVNPKVYIACGISGSVQHFAGMKSSEMIIAVNKDPDAAIVGKCDYFIVGDLFEIIPEVTRALAERGR
jgi:electron transfer flavoprotein alpha subunit